MKPKIGIRPVIDGRVGGVRETLEEQTMQMALAAKEIIGKNVFYTDGTPAEVIIASRSIGGVAEAAMAEEEFRSENVCATLSVTPCWCFGAETMDTDPMTIKAVWGFNGTERSGAVYLAAVMAAYAQKGLPAFAIYGRDVMDKETNGLTDDVRQKIVMFAKCAMAVGQLRNKSYLSIGAVCMGIAGSYCNEDFYQEYLNIRPEWVDMSEVLRRIEKNIFDADEYKKAAAWAKKNCPPGDDNNSNKYSAGEKDKQWETTIKTALIIKDLMKGNPALEKTGWIEESLGKNAIMAGFQGQRMWTDFMPSADFPEAILNSSFDWNGKREPIVVATENDGLNGVSMLLGKLITNKASVFADVRTYWSPDAVKRVTGWEADGLAENGFIHLINSGAAALDGTGRCQNEKSEPCFKEWWNLTDRDIEAMLKATRWAPDNRGYFRGGGFSSQFNTKGIMPVTLIRLNLIKKLGPVLQLAEGWTVDLPEKVNKTLLDRTDSTWPSTWFVPRLNGKGAFKDVYSVMANWGANHAAFCHGHTGAEIITLASMLRIPVSLHNIEEPAIFRPHLWSAYGTADPEGADFRACKDYGPLYR